MSSWVHKAAAALIALTLTAAPPASAQPVPSLRDYLIQQLDTQEADVAEDGFALAAGPLTGLLGASRAAALPITLRVGQDIRIVGVCDRACGDLDLRLTDPRGQIVALDTRGNARPVLDVRPTVTGQYTIEVGMLECDAPRCRFAVNVYTR